MTTGAVVPVHLTLHWNHSSNGSQNTLQLLQITAWQNKYILFFFFSVLRIWLISAWNRYFSSESTQKNHLQLSVKFTLEEKQGINVLLQKCIGEKKKCNDVLNTMDVLKKVWGIDFVGFVVFSREQTLTTVDFI